MQYMLLIYGDESRRHGHEPGGGRREHGRVDGLHRGAPRRGASKAGDALQPTATATTVTRGDDGAALVTDGPFAETREQLGGYYLLDVKDLDEAIEWARKCPGSKNGKIELRPVMEFDQG